MRLVAERRSPVIYEARKDTRTFTAICQPPYFTALAFWEYSSPWTGGGFFANDRTVVLGLKFEDPRANNDFPTSFNVTASGATLLAANGLQAGSMKSLLKIRWPDKDGRKRVQGSFGSQIQCACASALNGF